MEIDVKALIEKAKGLPRPLKIVGIILALEIIAVGAAELILSDELEDRQSRVNQLRADLSQVRKQNADARKQISQYPDMLVHYNQAIAGGVTANIDRLKLLNDVQDFAVHRFVGGLHYKLDTDSEKPDPKVKYHLESTSAAFDGGGLLDTEVLALWDDIFTDVPAHYRVTEAFIERRRDVDNSLLADIRAGRPAAMLGMRLSLRWSSLRPNSQETQ
jgi:hypothetical protein